MTTAPPDPNQNTSKKTKNLLWTLTQPVEWVRKLTWQLNPTFIAGVFIVYGVGQGFSGSLFRVVTDYYWKDVQKLQPSTVQFYFGIYFIPWLLKPLWGILTDAFPVAGYRRRPYFVIAGVLGTACAIVVALWQGLAAAGAVICFVGVSASLAIADVTIDACIARNSIEVPSLAPELQSLCGYCAGIGALVGYLASGFFVHHLGPQESLGLMALSPALTIVLGFVMYENRTSGSHNEKKEVAVESVGMTIRSMHKRMKCPQEFVGLIYAFGSVASLLGVLIYQKTLKDFAFRNLLFYAQLFYAISGVLDLIFILRWNLIIGIPDYFFVFMEETATRITSKIRWMPMMVLSTQLCPIGIEGTFFALLMSIDSSGALISKWGGGLLLRLLHVTRTNFTNLWLAALIRDLLRFATLALVFLVPKAGQYEGLHLSEVYEKHTNDHDHASEETLELVPIISRTEV
ncbi:probable folate-biopterin transporter 6 isoform X2 [Lotus japonicus]|uniref:probable folate-biopterin transporter 6 isoform X2 n=1 Tax=Lotus japonicus TaxID=34305 RepID=UPI00258A9C3D|nr:probable folate-biopterin transporter 6 isoform X2 [Lotus japonicus]